MWLFHSGLFDGMFLLVFLLVIGTFAVILVSGLRRWNRNNHAPRLTVEARVVSRRTSVSSHSGSKHGMHHTATRYHVTFEVDSGDRMEFSVAGSEYGLLAEGDRGRLTFQGTRYLSFARVR